MQGYRTVLIMCIVAFMGGCASHPLAPQQNKTEPKQAVYPDWVTNPDVGGHTGAVGYARPQGSEMRQRQTALIVAKARLSERMNVDIHTISISRISDVNGKASREFHEQSLQTSSSRIHRVVFRDEFRDKAGVYYLWLTADKEQ